MMMKMPRRGVVVFVFGSLVLLSLFTSFLLYLESNRHVTRTRRDHQTVEDITRRAWMGVQSSLPPPGSHSRRQSQPLQLPLQLQLKALPSTTTTTNANSSLAAAHTTKTRTVKSDALVQSIAGGGLDLLNGENSNNNLNHNNNRPALVPPLSSLLDQHGNVTGNVQFLLDFAIVGFGKCGTSTIMHWLAQHPEIRCFQDEIWELMYGTIAQLVTMLYEQDQRCYKCPAEVTQAHIMDVYATLWPQTKHMIGIRHPIRHFESLYNFRVQNLGVSSKEDLYMPHPNKLIGRCTKGMKHACTDMSNFAYHLIRLGKQHWNGTRPETPLERQIVGRYRRAAYNTTALHPQPNPIFLYTVEQLADRNASRQAQFRTDVQSFLGLHTPLPPLLHFSPGRRWTEAQQRKRDALKIDVCDPEYAPVRRELMRLATQNGQWIADFLTFPGVTVSSPEFVRDALLNEWMRDPCTNETYPATPVHRVTPLKAG